MTITYETLFEILRKEKNQEDLQTLEQDFFVEVEKYVREKSDKLNENPRLNEFMEGHEQQMNALRTQISNIKRLIRDIFERRERKIIEMAVNKAKTGSNIVDTSALLPQEKLFFEEQINTITKFIENNLNPSLGLQKPANDVSKPKDLNMAHSEENNELKKVKITEAVPKFVGVDLEVYGPYDTSDEIELNPEIADMLIKTNKAKIVE